MTMRRLLIRSFAVLALMASAEAMAARQKVDETRNAASDGFVRIIVVRGHLRVEGWDQDKIHVSGLLDEKTKQFIFDVDKDSATVEVRLPSGMSSWCCADGSDLVVQIPKGSRLDVSVVSTDTDAKNIVGGLVVNTVSGDLTVNTSRDRVNVTSVSGDVELRKAEGRITVKSVSGDINMYDSKGNLKLHSVSGDIVARNVGNELDMQSISGDIESDNTSYEQVSGSTVSGDVDIAGRMQPGGSLDFDSVSGTIRVSFKGDVDARFDLEAGSGSIRNHLSDDKPDVSRYARQETLRFIQGSGKGEVTLSTRSGDIALSRQ
jgi:hypothetical protein